MTNTFCPLYKQAIEAKPWEQKESAHAGLLFDKYPSAWRWNPKETRYEFDNGVGKKKEGANDWINSITKSNFNTSLIIEACQRQRAMVEKLGGEIIVLTNSSRFVTGMGREHPLENGFTWHHTFGVPYLPGSSLKGIVRAWYHENEWEELKQLFGSSKQGVGNCIFLDMLPLEKPKLVVEIMTPHYGPYYQDDTGGTAPGDWHNPVPIPFLAVEAGTSWQLAIIPGPAHRTIDKVDIVFDKLITEIPEALKWLGAGAKTAVGYGRFCPKEEFKKSYSTNTTAVPSPETGDTVEAVLLEEKTKKMGWKAKHEPTGLSGPIQNSKEVPAGMNAGDPLKLIVASVKGDQSAFKYPTDAEQQRVNKPKKNKQKKKR